MTFSHPCYPQASLFSKPWALMPPWRCSRSHLGLKRLISPFRLILQSKGEMSSPFCVLPEPVSFYLTTISRQKTWLPLFYNLSYNIMMISSNVYLLLKSRDLKSLRIGLLWDSVDLVGWLVGWYSGKLAG